MTKLTKIEEALLKEIDEEPYDAIELNDKQLPYTRGQLKITHRASCMDPVALFRPPVVICYGGKFRGKEFVAIGDTDEGFEYIGMAVVSKVRSVIIKKVAKWVKRDTFLTRLIPPGMTLEMIAEQWPFVNVLESRTGKIVGGL